MILNTIVMFFLIGWTINAAVYQAQHKMRITQFWMNAILAVVAGEILVWRLS